MPFSCRWLCEMKLRIFRWQPGQYGWEVSACGSLRCSPDLELKLQPAPPHSSLFHTRHLSRYLYQRSPGLHFPHPFGAFLPPPSQHPSTAARLTQMPSSAPPAVPAGPSPPLPWGLACCHLRLQAVRKAAPRADARTFSQPQTTQSAFGGHPHSHPYHLSRNTAASLARRNAAIPLSTVPTPPTCLIILGVSGVADFSAGTRRRTTRGDGGTMVWWRCWRRRGGRDGEVRQVWGVETG
jgi:hypothetical protein